MNPRGLKMWGDTTDAKHIEEAARLIKYGIFDYIEVTPTPEGSVEMFDIGVPIIIHSTHERWGTNLSDRAKHEFTMRMLQNSFEWADILQAPYVIVHPGYGPIDAAVELLDDIVDKRVLVENMPVESIYSDRVLNGYSIEQLNVLMGGRYGFCMDVGHAIKAAYTLRVNYWGFLLDMMDCLHPKMFHLADGYAESGHDDHLSIGEGNFDMKFIKSILSERPLPVTFETKRTETLGEDVKNVLRYLSI